MQLGEPVQQVFEGWLSQLDEELRRGDLTTRERLRVLEAYEEQARQQLGQHLEALLDPQLARRTLDGIHTARPAPAPKLDPLLVSLGLGFATTAAMVVVLSAFGSVDPGAWAGPFFVTWQATVGTVALAKQQHRTALAALGAAGVLLLISAVG